MTRVFMDSEFMEDGEVILPLSFGFVAETGERLYLVIDDADRSKANPWVKENVLPHLDIDPSGLDSEQWIERGAVAVSCSRAEAGPWINDWLTGVVKAEKPEFWADFASYDWIVLCQLFGRMIDLPKGFPMFCMDIQQFKRHVGFDGKLPEVEGQAHNALDDAANVQERHRILTEFEESLPMLRSESFPLLHSLPPRMEDLEEYAEEPAEAIALGQRLTKGKPWPESVRFAVNPRLSDAEEHFMKAITESGTTGTATAISIVRDLRAAGLGVGFILPESR